MSKLLIGADIFLAALFLWRFQHLPDQIPLLYSRPWGEDQIVDYWYIALLPILMHLFYAGNTIISKKLFPTDPLPHKIFSIANIFIVVVFTVIMVRILLLVT